jgi:RNA polymerase sigma-70 factor, ECF subfamily
MGKAQRRGAESEAKLQVGIPTSGADDGIRTRDPHLGKVPWAGSLTCSDCPIPPVSSTFWFPCNPTVSRRFPVVDGTPTGPLEATHQGAQPPDSPAKDSQKRADGADVVDRPKHWPPLARLSDGTVEAIVASAELEGGLDFVSFFQAEYEPLLRTMYVLCRNLAEAEDLAQEAMARAFERWEKVRAAASPRAYVYAIALNLRRSALRRAALAIRHGQADATIPDDPDTLAERRVEILRALRSLPQSQREALLLVDLVGMTSEEAGRVLGIEADSVRGRIHRARRALRERYGGSTDG